MTVTRSEGWVTVTVYEVGWDENMRPAMIKIVNLYMKHYGIGKEIVKTRFRPPRYTEVKPIGFPFM